MKSILHTTNEEKNNYDYEDIAADDNVLYFLHSKVAYTALDTALHEVANRTMIPGSLLHNLKVTPWLLAGISVVLSRILQKV